MNITDTSEFAVVDAIAHNLTHVLSKYAENVVSDEIATELLAEDMTEVFEAIITQLHAIEILECVVYSNATAMKSYVVQFHDLKECMYGFDMLKRENIEKTTCYHFETAREAFAMIAQIINV